MPRRRRVPNPVIDSLRINGTKLELAVEELRKSLAVFCREMKYFPLEYAVTLHEKFFRQVREADDRLLDMEKAFGAYFDQLTLEGVPAILGGLSRRNQAAFINAISEVIELMARVLAKILNVCDPLVERSRVMIHQMMAAARNS
ncbi:uncharacterized protein [Anabrus simplex]|uniref:uncharacterized protein n=1 Tax=Anabrus simplex TaxID=316456 RepID=UPI0035A33481